jgi:hypothetical protein
MFTKLRRWLARRWMLRKLDKLGMPRSESTRLIDVVLDSKFPTQ